MKHAISRLWHLLEHGDLLDQQGHALGDFVGRLTVRLRRGDADSRRPGDRLPGVRFGRRRRRDHRCRAVAARRLLERATRASY